MRTALFPRLAWSGIRKNRKLYLPYFFSVSGMVMMYCILHSLSTSPAVVGMKSGHNVGFVLSLGKFVIAVFALLFLFYTNSFLIRRRYKEFGLYNILGMDKRGIAKVLLWETLMLAAAGIFTGLVLGLLLSKLAELGLLNMIHEEIDYRISVSAEAVVYTVCIFGAVFLLLTLKSLWNIFRLNPLDLLKSEAVGEKPPKGNRIVALLGAGILAGAYTIAVRIRNPLAALLWFFVAVIMVILATYLLFGAGSVVLCRILQKNPRYYYRKNHFVSVSSMVYRMKRNGAGLASICILSTMVLVMLSSTASLYFGEENALSERFPQENMITVHAGDPASFTEENLAALDLDFDAVFAGYGAEPKNPMRYRYASCTAKLDGTEARADAWLDSISADYGSVRTLFFFSAADYSRLTGVCLSPAAGEAYLYPIGCTYEETELNVDGIRLHMAGTLDWFPDIAETHGLPVSCMMLVISDYEELGPLLMRKDARGNDLMEFQYYYGYDTDLPDEESASLFMELRSRIICHEFPEDGDDGFRYSAASLAVERSDFYSTYGGLFFLGIILSAVFLFGAGMIIYYKQVSEGYEDKARFDIMQKVGMTKEDIRRNIDAQVLTVFFAPLLAAGVHLCFAFPMLWKILQLFMISRLGFVIGVTAVVYGLFAAFYTVIYRLTARVYYGIVSAGEEN